MSVVSEIVSTGHAYPSELVDNEAFLARCQFKLGEELPALVAQTRMRTRAWCRDSENTWTLARAAVDRAIAAAPEAAADIDLVLVASGTTMPLVHAPDPQNAGVADLAPLIIRHLGRDSIMGLDLKACYCTGFLRSLEVADAMLRAGTRRSALVVATEQGSRFAVAESNRSTFCFLMSDAAGAAILRARPRATRTGILDHVGHTDASKLDWVGIGPDARSTVMRGSKVAVETIDLLSRCARTLLARNHLTPADVDWLIPIQTHAQVIDALVSALDWPRDRLIWRGDVTGFAGSASVPACLAEQMERGVVRKGDLILSVAVGAGLNCAGTLFHA
jgi:3-oxoacyl-[acyl-carrier-protein] synthase III